MADSFVQLSPDSSGKKMDTRTEASNSEHRQVMVLGDPATNAGVAPVDGTKGLAVDLSNTGANTNKLLVTPDSVALPANQSVNQAQVAGTTTDTNSGTKSAGTQRVVIATDQPALTNKLLVTPDLPSGASTAAKQPALGTAGTASADVLTVQGITSMTALKTDSSATTQPVSGTVTANAGSGTLAVSLATNTPTLQSGSTTAVTQATAANLNATVTPASATGSAVPAVAQPAGLQARTTDLANLTSGNLTMAISDKAGKAVTLPYSIPELFISGTGSATGTSGTSVIAAQGASVKIYITAISVVNTGAAGSLVTIQIDPAGTPTTLWQMVNPSGGGSNITFPVPLVVTANKAVGFTAATASTTQYVSISGYTGA